MRPGFLDNPQVIAWLDGVEPAWTLLDFGSYCRLEADEPWLNGSLQLADDLPLEALAGSAFAGNAMILLRRAAREGGLKLTATGNLSRSVVSEMCDAMAWPSIDMEDLFHFNKVVNEPDFWPLHLLRLLAVEAKLLRKHKGVLVPTKAATSLVRTDAIAALQTQLFRTAFWRVNLSYFDGYPLQGWPESRIGSVLWSLSVASASWTPVERLMRLSTVPVNGVLEATWDFPASAFEARVLRPLHWFGLLECRAAEPHGPEQFVRPSFRKTPLFDSFVRFDVVLEGVEEARH